MELNNLGDIFLNSAILTAIIRITWSTISEAINRIRYFFIITFKTFIIPLKLSESHDLLKNCAKFYCLIIRYGTDDYIKDMASDKEKYDGRLQNKVIPINIYLDENDLFLKFKLPIHKRLGTQFKCFVEVEDPQKLEKIYSILENKCKNISKPSKSSSQFRYRVYFLLNDFGIVKTVEGIENNMCFPI